VQLNLWAVGGIMLVAFATFYIGYRSSRLASTTPDFLVARRAVRSSRNAAAVSGEYLSAASFLGVAGLVLKDGVDALWYPIGFTAGYLALMVFVAAPVPTRCRTSAKPGSARGACAGCPPRSSCSSGCCTWSRSCRAPG
jgi:Na+(H+)/acetate symporter ActP